MTFFDNFLSDPEESNMKCDIYEKDGDYHIEMDVPGFKKEDIKIECDKGYLTITAEKHSEDKEEDKRVKNTLDVKDLMVNTKENSILEM